MNDMPTAAAEMARQAPLTLAASYLTFMSTYGAAIVTTLAIVYGVLQLVLRAKEHKAIMRKNKIEE